MIFVYQLCREILVAHFVCDLYNMEVKAAKHKSNKTKLTEKPHSDLIK